MMVPPRVKISVFDVELVFATEGKNVDAEEPTPDEMMFQFPKEAAATDVELRLATEGKDFGTEGASSGKVGLLFPREVADVELRLLMKYKESNEELSPGKMMVLRGVEVSVYDVKLVPSAKFEVDVKLVLSGKLVLPSEVVPAGKTVISSRLAVKGGLVLVDSIKLGLLVPFELTVKFEAKVMESRKVGFP